MQNKSIILKLKLIRLQFPSTLMLAGLWTPGIHENLHIFDLKADWKKWYTYSFTHLTNFILGSCRNARKIKINKKVYDIDIKSLWRTENTVLWLFESYVQAIALSAGNELKDMSFFLFILSSLLLFSVFKLIRLLLFCDSEEIQSHLNQTWYIDRCMGVVIIVWP